MGRHPRTLLVRIFNGLVGYSDGLAMQVRRPCSTWISGHPQTFSRAIPPPPPKLTETRFSRRRNRSTPLAARPRCMIRCLFSR